MLSLCVYSFFSENVKITSWLADFYRKDPTRATKKKDMHVLVPKKKLYLKPDPWRRIEYKISTRKKNMVYNSS